MADSRFGEWAEHHLTPFAGDAAALLPAAAAEAETLADPELVHAWLRAIAVGPKGAPREPAALLAASATTLVAVRQARIPAACFTEEAAAQALATFVFWPAPAEIVAMLRPHAERLRGNADWLRRVATARAAPPPQAREAFGYKAPPRVHLGEEAPAPKPGARPPQRSVADQIAAALGQPPAPAPTPSAADAAEAPPVVA